MENGSRRYGVLFVRIPQMIPDPNSHKVDGQIVFGDRIRSPGFPVRKSMGSIAERGERKSAPATTNLNIYRGKLSPNMGSLLLDSSLVASGWITSRRRQLLTNYRVGMLIVSMFERTSKQLIWRATSSSDLSGNPEKNTKKLDKDVQKMFKKFPPKK